MHLAEKEFKMKISVSSYSFKSMLSNGCLTQIDCVAKAKQMGFDAIEFVDILAPQGAEKEEYAKMLADECQRMGINVSSFTFNADFLKGSNGDIKAEIARVKKMVDIAEMLNAKFIRHDATTGDGRDFDAVLPIISDACREITQYAQSKGIKTTVENHGYFCQGSDRVNRLYNAVDHPNFGLLADFGNFLCVDESPEKAVEKIAANTIYAHAKDFHVKLASDPDPGEGFFRSQDGNYLRGAIIGHGNVPVKKCLLALKNAGYRGYIAVEFEGMEDPIRGISIGHSNLKRYIKEIE